MISKEGGSTRATCINRSGRITLAQYFEPLGPATDSFVFWPTDVLRPPASTMETARTALRGEPGTQSEVPTAVQWTEPDWEQGRRHRLQADTEDVRVRLAPGVDYG